MCKNDHANIVSSMLSCTLTVISFVLFLRAYSVFTGWALPSPSEDILFTPPQYTCHMLRLTWVNFYHIAACANETWGVKKATGFWLKIKMASALLLINVQSINFGAWYAFMFFSVSGGHKFKYCWLCNEWGGFNTRFTCIRYHVDCDQICWFVTPISGEPVDVSIIKFVAMSNIKSVAVSPVSDSLSTREEHEISWSSDFRQ